MTQPSHATARQARINANHFLLPDFSFASIGVIRGLLPFHSFGIWHSDFVILLVSIRVHSWLMISRGKGFRLD
jgi:hypothetical protein